MDYDNKKSEIFGTLAGVKIMAVTWPEKSSIGFVDDFHIAFEFVRPS